MSVFINVDTVTVEHFILKKCKQLEKNTRATYFPKIPKQK